MIGHLKHIFYGNYTMYFDAVGYHGVVSSTGAETHVYHLPTPTENKIKTYMKYGCDKQTGRQSVTSSNVSSHISKGSAPRFCKKQKNTNFKVNFNRIYT